MRRILGRVMELIVDLVSPVGGFLVAWLAGFLVFYAGSTLRPRYGMLGVFLGILGVAVMTVAGLGAVWGLAKRVDP